MEKFKKNWPYFIYGGMVVLYLYFRLLNPVNFYVGNYDRNSEGYYDETVTDKVELQVDCSTRWVITFPEEYNGKKVASAYMSGNFEDECPYTVKINFNKNLEEFHTLFWSIGDSRLSEMTFSKDTRFGDWTDTLSPEKIVESYKKYGIKVNFHE